MYKIIKEFLKVCSNYYNKKNEELKLEEKELEESIKYYENKLKNLKFLSKKHRNIYYCILTVSVLLFLICIGMVCYIGNNEIENERITTFVDIIATIALAIIFLMAGRAWTVYLTVDEKILEYRDELFKSFTKLKRIRELDQKEQDLYDSLMERLN